MDRRHHVLRQALGEFEHCCPPLLLRPRLYSGSRRLHNASPLNAAFFQAEGRFTMIKTEIISANVLKIIAPEKLKADDFRQITPQIDSVISRYGKIRLLIDASGFNGWENIAAFENHAGFIKNHQQKVERIAVIVAHDWQHWLIGAVRMFLHPE